MHPKLLYVLSHPELFAEAAEWQTKVDMGIDPSRPSSSTNDVVIGVSGGEDGMASFEHEFDGPKGRCLYCLNLNCRAPLGRFLQLDLTGWWRDV
jgi:hypothetical protein